jgi:uncharacterized protein (TIGR00725 family)
MAETAGRAPLYVAVIGPSAAGDAECTLAAEVGRLLAGAGDVVLTGSVAGVSAAAAAAAAAGGGTVLTLVPGLDRPTGPDAPPLSLPTGLGELCNGLLVRAADVLLSVGGGWGTLLETALARRTDVPVVALAGWTVLDPRGVPVPGQVSAADPAGAVHLARAAGERRRAAGPRTG